MNSQIGKTRYRPMGSAAGTQSCKVCGDESEEACNVLLSSLPG
jgi:hypothetical protein